MDTQRAHKTRLFELFAQIAKALANPGRLELLDYLAQGPHTVEELALKVQMSVANTSQHLQRLRQAHLVDVEQDGTFRRYQLADPIICELWHLLRLVAFQQLAEVEQVLDAYRSRRHEFEQITAEELHARLQSGDVILIDARPPDEYEAGHLPGALSSPISEVEKLLDYLPGDKQVVAYCRGPQCILADDVLAVLAEQGRQVARLDDGVIEWQLAGYEIEQSET